LHRGRQPIYLIAQLELGEPCLGDGLHSQPGAHKVAGHRGGAVAVARVVGGQTHGCGEVVVMDEGAVDGNGQRLLSDPARAELLDDVR